MALLKWYGLYQHNAQDGHFMQRIKVVQGVLTGRAGRDDRRASRATSAAASSTARRASASRSTGSRSTRSPRSSSRLDACGLTTKGACGDITRNVVGCTLAGIGHEELVDGHGTARRSTSTSSATALLQPAAQVQDLDHRLP
jgi:ferredoxin-nitrite reductase